MKERINSAPKLVEVVIIHKSNKNSLEAIGADNFRGSNEIQAIIDLGIDNFRAKPKKIGKSDK